MKKIISLILCAIMLTGILSVAAFAKETDMEFSIKGAEGEPGDTVDVEVYLDKNAGTWAMKFLVCFDSKALKLKDVTNGTVYGDSDFTKSVLTNDGYYIYYAQMASPTVNNTATGLVLTLSFEITERATNGYHNVWLTFPDNGIGWFFDANDLNNDRTVPDDGAVKTVVTVSGSDATSELETDDKGVIADKETKAPVTAYVTDTDGEIVTDDKGTKETYVVENGKIEDVPQYVTDTNGDYVRDEDGKLETVYLDKDGNVIDKTTAAGDTTSASGTDNEGSQTKRKLIIIAAVAAVVVATVIIIIVVTSAKKKTESNDKED